MSENPFAFPSPDDDRPSDGYGMTLRDWFAGQALTNSAICTGSASDYQLIAWFGRHRTGIMRHEISARQAFDHADAMLEARSSKAAGPK